MAKNDGWEDIGGDGWEDVGSSPSFMDKAIGVGQTAASMITGGLAQPISGIIGAADTAIRGPQKGTETIRKVQENLTYEPSREKGKEYTEKLSNLMEAGIDRAGPIMGQMAEAIPFIGDKLFEKEDARDATGKALAEIGMNFLPVEGVTRPFTWMRDRKAAKIAEQAKLKEAEEKVKSQEATKRADAAKAAEVGWEDLPHQQEMFPQNPYDVGGHVTAAQEGRPTMLDNPQGEMFGHNEPLPNQLDGQGELFPELGSKQETVPHMENNVPDQYTDPRQMSLQLEQNPPIHVDSLGRVVPDGAVHMDEATKAHWEAQQRAVQERAMAEADARRNPKGFTAKDPLDVGTVDQPFDNGVRTTDPVTGGVIQGMDKSVPTVDFPLKTEMIDSDPKITELRQRIASTEADIAEMKSAGKDASVLEGTLNYLKQEFGDYMDKSYGVLEKGDAYPALVEAGGNTKLPIEHTHNAGKRSLLDPFKTRKETTRNAAKEHFGPPRPRHHNLKKQKGAVDQDLLTFGVSRLIDYARNKYGNDRGALSKFIGTFNVEALKAARDEHRDPKSRESLYWMRPDSFLKAAQERRLDNEAMREEKRGSIRNGLKTDNGLDAIPFLMTENGQVIGHEGRHRMDVFKEQGLDMVPVRIRDASHRNSAGPLPYDFLKGQDGHVVKMPERMKLDADPEPVKSATDSIMDRVKQQNENSARLGKFGKQGGAVNVKEIKEGLLELFGKKVPDHVANAAAEHAAEQATQAPTVDRVNKLQALKDSAVGKGIGDFLNTNMTPQEVIEGSKGAPDIERKWFRENTENGAQFRVIDTKNLIVKATHEWVTDATLKSVKWVKENITGPNGIKTNMREMNDSEKASIWKFMMEHEGHRRFSYDELRELGFNEHQSRFADNYYNLSDAFFKRINAVREKMGMPPMDYRIAHIAGRFMGDFRRMVYKIEDGKRVPIGFIGASQHHPTLGKFGMKGELDRAADWIKENHPDWEIGPVEYKGIGKGHMKTGVDRFAGFMEALNMIGRESPDMAKLLDTYRDFLKNDSARFLDHLRHAKAKKAEAGGMTGSEGNKTWKDDITNSQEGMKAQLAYFEQGSSWIEMQEATNKLKQVFGDEELAKTQPNAIAYSSKYLDHALGRNPSFVADFVNSLASAVGEHTGFGHTNLRTVSHEVKHRMMQKFMGFVNVPFTVAQFFQPVQAMPGLMVLLKSRGENYSALGAVTKGLNSALKISKALAFPESTKFSAFEKEALKYAEDRDIFNVRMVDHEHGINKNVALEGFDAIADFNIKAPEHATRSIAFMTYAHALKDAGYSTLDALQAAENMTNTVMVNYRPQERAQMYRGLGLLGDMASTLSSYKHNQLSQFNMYRNEATRHGHYAPLITFLGTSLATQGLLGFFGFQSADALYQWYTTHFTDHPDSLTALLLRAKEIPEFVTHGMFASLGLDMSSRFSSAQVLPDSPTGFLFPFGSGLAEMAETAADAVSNPNEFNAMRAARAFVPNSARGLIEQQYFTKDVPNGKLAINPNKAEGQYVRDETEGKLRNFGFRSLKESKELAANYQQRAMDNAQVQKLKGLVENLQRELASNSLTQEKSNEYYKRFLELGSDKYAEVLQAAAQGLSTTELQRFIIRNGGANYHAAKNLQERAQYK